MKQSQANLLDAVQSNSTTSTNEELLKEARLYREIAKKSLEEIRLYRDFAKKNVDEIALLYARVSPSGRKADPTVDDAITERSAANAVSTVRMG